MLDLVTKCPCGCGVEYPNGSVVKDFFSKQELANWKERINETEMGG